jgi:EmrB/QacA subfamily drug resistance transporter
VLRRFSNMPPTYRLIPRGNISGTPTERRRHDPINVPDHMIDADSGTAPAISTQAWRTLAITSVVVFMVSLELTIIALALPEIGDAFPAASDATLSWILTVYNIGVASLLLFSGWWADKSGRKKVFLIGLALFATGSVLAAVAPTIELLIVARGIQSIGGAVQYPAGLALLLPAFPVERRQMAIGIWGAMGALAASVAPSFGAVLVNAFGWRSIFAINVPVAILAIIAGRIWLDESRGEVPESRVDLIGVPLASIGVGAIILGIVQAGEWGPGSPAQIFTIVLGIVLVVAFIVRSRTHPAPLFDLDLLKLRSFSDANIGMVAFTMAFFSWVVTLPTFMQDEWSWSVLEAGFAIAPGPLIAMLTSPPLGRLADRIGPAPVLMLGGLSGAIGLGLQRLVVTLEPNYLLMILLPGSFVGLAAGCSFAMLVGAAMRDVPPAQFGMAGAGRSTMFQLAIALGVALGFGLTAGTESGIEALAANRRLWVVGAVFYFLQFLVFWKRYPRDVPTAAS